MTSKQNTPVATTSRELTSPREVPSWLTEPQAYDPLPDRDGFIAQSMLSMSSMLARMRLDNGFASPFSPAAPLKLLIGLATVLLVSLSRNYLFVLVVLAAVIMRAAVLPSDALKRVAATACTAAAITLLIMSPAAFMGQPRSTLTLATKALVSTAIVMECALTTPFSHLTGALRSFGIPSLFILTLDLTLRSIVRLGETALETLDALKLRSVGHNRDKTGSIGGIGGVVLVKAANAAQTTHDAMRCRGFDGEYDVRPETTFGWTDVLWIMLFILLFALFLYLQSQVSYASHAHA